MSPRIAALDREGQVFVGKVDRGFEMGERAGQPPRPIAVEAAKLAIELAQSVAPLGLGLGRGEIGDRLGLGQVELVVQKRAAGEFAGLGQPQPEPAQCRDNRRQNGAAAVQVELRDILAGKARRRRKPQDESVVEGLACLGIDEPAAARRPRGRKIAGERAHRARGVGAGQPQHRDGGAPGRRRRGEDGVRARQHTLVSPLPGLDPGIHVSERATVIRKTWVAGSRPATGI